MTMRKMFEKIQEETFKEMVEGEDQQEKKEEKEGTTAPESSEHKAEGEETPAESTPASSEEPSPTSESTPAEKDYKDLAEKALIVKHLKKKGELSEKEKEFISSVESIELTEEDRGKVNEEMDKILKGQKESA
jgi:hypothetical protein